MERRRRGRRQFRSPGAEATRLHFVYDAWNRMVEVRNDNNGSAGTLAARYEYDGLGRRISRTVGGERFDYFYNESWQVVEVDRKVGAGDSRPFERSVWDARYIDAPVLRQRDTDGDGAYDQTLYYTQDANFNVTALVNPAGTVVERYSYDAYGKAAVYDGDWTVRPGGSAYDNQILFGAMNRN